MRGFVLLLGMFCLTVPFAARAEIVKDDNYAREIMQKVEDREDGKDSVSLVTIEISDRFGESHSVRILRLRKDFGKDGLDQYTYSFILSPPEMAGMRVLTKDYRDIRVLDDQWIFIPGISGVKRIAIDSYTSRLMGSDITYGDLSSRDLDLYDFKYVGTERIGRWMTEVIEFRPNTPEEVRRFGYTSGKVWVDPKSWLVVRSIFRMADGGRSKLFITHDMEQVDGIWTPTEMSFITHKDGNVVSSTRMKLEKTRFNVGLPDELYDVERMMSLRLETLLKHAGY